MGFTLLNLSQEEKNKTTKPVAKQKQIYSVQKEILDFVTTRNDGKSKRKTSPDPDGRKQNQSKIKPDNKKIKSDSEKH